MSYENKGSFGPTVKVTREPDRSGNWVCDGVADDVQIQAAIDFVEVLPEGGMVFLGPGDYEITTAILIQNCDNVVLAGSGWHSTILTTSGADTTGIQIGDRVNSGLAAQDIVIRDLYIDGTSQTTEVDGPEANDRRFGIQVASPGGQTQRVLIENCYIYNTGSDSIYGYESPYVFVYDNIVQSTRAFWASIHGHGDSNNWIVVRNYVFNSAVSAIRHGRIIAENWTHDCGLDGATNGREACIVGGITIANNRMESNAAGGVTGIKSFAAGSLIIGNHYTDASFGVFIHVEHDGVSVVSNWTGNDNNIVGVKVEDASGVMIIGNRFQRMRFQGVLLRGATECIVADNSFYGISKDNNNTYPAIRLEDDDSQNSCTYNLIVDNQIYSDLANLPNYGIDEADANQDYNRYEDNVIQNVVTALARIQGPNAEMPAAQTQFTEPVNGVIVTTSPTGIEVNAATEEAIAWGQVPIKSQEVQRIKVWAVALGAPIGAGGQMHLEITFNAGASNAAYNTAAKSWNIVSFDGEEADYVANDVVHWVIEDGDVGNEIRNLAPGDSFEIRAIYEDGANPDGATNARFRVVELEFI